MRRRLTQAITVGLSLAGCGDRAIPDGSAEGSDGGTGSTSGDASEGGPSTTIATSAGNTTSATSTTETGADAESEAGTTDPPKFDLAAAPDIAIEEPSVLDCNAPPPTASCMVGPADADIEWVRVCIPPDAGGACPLEMSSPVWVAVDDCLVSTEWTASGCGGGAAQNCPTVIEDGQCCYWQGFEGYICPGRPFLVDGRERTAPLVHRDDWSAPWRAPAMPDALLAHAWCFDARNEHAAIASFCRFTMQLLAMAAPPRFVAAAVQAAADERDHAMLFFALAGAHGGEALGPGALDIAGALAGSDDPIEIVVATVREGCIAETISAMQLQHACRTAADPQLRTALERVLAQELQHVELAWSFVAWACANGDARMRAAVAGAFTDAARWIPRGPDVDPAATDRAHWHRAGRLCRAEAHAIALHTIRTIVRPSADELLARLPITSDTHALHA
jgi:hypothetical protein